VSTAAGGAPHHLAPGVGAREQSAAAVAQYLMRGGGNNVGQQDDDTSRTTMATTTAATSLESSQHSLGGAAAAAAAAAGGGGGSGLNQQDLLDYHRRYNESIGKLGGVATGGGGGGAMGGGGGVIRTVRSEGDHRDDATTGTTDDDDDDDEDDEAAEGGVCLGTLTIALSRLPLEEVFLGKDAAVVEQWYQLDDPNLNKRGGRRRESTRMRDEMGGEGSEANGGGSGGGGGGTTIAEDDDDDDDDEEPTLLKGPRRCPSVLLEITFASSDHLNSIEDREIMKCFYNNADDGRSLDLGLAPKDSIGGKHKDFEKNDTGLSTSPSPATPTPVPSRKPDVETKIKKKEEPELEPGIVDYVCIVGARDIGNQRRDDGSKGWVQSTPECCVLERYPPTDDFHVNNGRNVGLIPQIEWFCFPEGCQLWRGVEAPSIPELVRGGVSIASSSLADAARTNNSSAADAAADGNYLPTKFDTALGTTCSFSWFVLSSNSDVYGSRLVKTYGVMIRFYVPAPKGIDPTQVRAVQSLSNFTVVCHFSRHTHHYKNL
jgi:hypothetical protein